MPVSVNAEVLVNTTTFGEQIAPVVTVLTGGGYVVTWYSNQQEGGLDLYAQLFDANGNPLGSETLVNTFTASDQYYPDVTALADGGYVIAWSSFQDGSSTGVYAQRYDANGNPLGAETLVNTTTAEGQQEPAIAGLVGGGYVVTWMDASLDGSGWGIGAQRYDANGSPVGSETRVNTTTFQSQTSPAVSALSDGGYVVVWNSADNNSGAYSSGVYGQRFDAQGQVVGGEVLVNTTTAGDQLWPAVAGLSGGGYVVTWMSYGQDGSQHDIYAQLYDPNGTALGTETRVNITTVDQQNYPAVSALSDGGYVVVWNSHLQDGSANGIYAQRYDADGNTLGGETLVNVTTEGDQLLPAVAALSDGGYIVTWMSNPQDGSGADIYSRAFSAVPETVGTSRNDKLNASDSADNLQGLGGNDALNGNGGDDWLFGGLGKDALNGGSGNDWLYGGSGNDNLTGGAGADGFVFNQAGFGPDVVTDFNANEGDKLDLRGLHLAFEDLMIAQQGKQTIINIGADAITLNKVDASSLHQSDFLL